VPVPDLTRAPVPASAALTVPDCMSNVAVDDSVPFWMVPPACNETPPFCVCVVPPRLRIAVAPFTVTECVIAPSVPALVSASVPLVMLVLPV
jgi:hypothetical protein